MTLIKNNFAILITALLAAVFTFGLFTYWQKKNNESTVSCDIEAINKSLTETELIDPTTGKNAYQDLINGKILLVILNTQCGACQKEVQFINENFSTISKYIRIFGITVENDKQIQEFSKNYNLKFPILSDAEGKIFNSLAIKCTPTNLVLSQGIIKRVFIGNPKNIEKIIGDLSY